MKKLLLAGAIGLSLVGCATTGTTYTPTQNSLVNRQSAVSILRAWGINC
ncbi:hypothetical protein [Moraxella bovis]|nr:hypothetical protein [Moraxella bovis]